MRILLCIRQDYNRRFAADSIQIIKLSKILRKEGYIVHINSGGINDFSSYDIVHLIGLNNAGEIYRYFKIANYYKSNIVLSPNYWNYKEYHVYKHNYENIKLWDRCSPYREEIIKKSKVIIYNSNIEKKLVEKDFKITGKNTIIRYGVEVEDEFVPLYSFKERYGLERYVLSVGKIIETKNQLSIAKACSELEIPLVLIGHIADKNYFKECMEFDNVKYFGFMDSYNIYNAYRFATVHVTGGFGEMPGLSSMEAAASGCNIVVSNDGCAEEYFGDMACYFNPYKYDELLEGINKKINTKKDGALKDYVVENYNWERYVQEVLEQYKNILESSSL